MQFVIFVIAEPNDKVCIIGNLPFNVATPLYINWLRDSHEAVGLFTRGRTELAIMFQQEVAQVYLP